MQRNRWGLALVLVVSGCTGLLGDRVDATVASVSPIRGESKLAGTPVLSFGRAGAGQELAVAHGGLARVALDEGGDLLVGEDTKVAAIGAASVRLSAGRIYARARGRTPLTIETPKGVLRLAEAEASIEILSGAVRAYVVRGEIAYRHDSLRGVVRAGRSLRLDGQHATAMAEALFQDWTGGLAEPGPRSTRAAEGVGTLEGRIPDAFGEARWPLVVRDMRVRVRVVGDLAVTEVEQVFFNPASESVEGLYRIRVPENAVLHRFAVDRDGHMVDGYVREKQQAAIAYQAQVYRGSTLDPALLEWDAPGSFRARIYPIGAGETRRIAIRYSEWLERPSADAPRIYRYRMAGGGAGPEIEEFALEADLGDAKATSVRAGHGARVDGDRVLLRRSDFRPESDFVLELESKHEATSAYRASHTAPRRDPRAGAAPAEEESDYFYLPLVVAPPGASSAPSPALDLVVVADLSAGTDRSHLELGRTVIEAMAATLRAEDRLAIVAGDLRVRAIEGAPDGRLGPASPERVGRLLDGLARMRSGGATDLGAMLTGAASLLDPTRPGVVVYVGDGSPTVGELGAGPLLETLGRLPTPLRAYAIAVGDDANLELLSALTRGGGLAERVETRAEAAEAALRFYAHAVRPVAQRVEVDLGAGIDRAYPRSSRDVVVGDVLPIVGRVRGSVPTRVTVKGVFGGRAFEQSVALETSTLHDEGDLRLRWANARLDQLLLGGAQRAEIADLGTRFGIITPFTSFYVPSAAEIAALGPSGASLFDQTRLASNDTRESSWSVLSWPLALLSISGCSSLDEKSAPPGPPMTTEAPSEEAEQAARADHAPPIAQAPTAPSAAPADQGGRNEPAPAPSTGLAGATASMGDVRSAGEIAANRYGAPAEPAQPAAPAADEAANDRIGVPPASAQAMLGGALGESSGGFGLGLRGTGSGGGGEGYGHGELRRSRRPDTEAERPASNAHASSRAASAPARDHATQRITITTIVDIDHQARRCSDAASLILEARKGLWRERLDRTYDPYSWARIVESATRACETPTWRDRRVLLDLALARAGSVPTMVSLYQELSQASSRLYLRRAILAKVRTPEDLRVVRAAFGAGSANTALIESELARAPDEASRLRVLRSLVARFGGDLDLSLRLLQALEADGRRDEALRVAETLRQHPLADAGVRTALGEMYLRFGDEAEARRAFSEIVEFAPNDELARRRLGDLYRAHGWFEDAYRQYQTLATIRPDDSTVLLLLAQAAAGAGRIDEALRLEQRLAETASPGGSAGPARTALLWSSVRLAELRKEAREAHADDRVRAYLAALRRGGMLREASDLRATLVWSHPDADVSLYASHPGLGLTRPADLSPELGLEAFDVKEREPGIYRLEVRRGTRDTLSRVDAKLVVVIREGKRDERIEVFPLVFDATHRTYAFAIDGDAVRTEAQGTTEVSR